LPIAKVGSFFLRHSVCFLVLTDQVKGRHVLLRVVCAADGVS